MGGLSEIDMTVDAKIETFVAMGVFVSSTYHAMILSAL